MAPDWPSYIDGSRVIERRPGQDTGDEYCRTEDGRCWKTCRNPHEVITGRDVRSIVMTAALCPQETTMPDPPEHHPDPKKWPALAVRLGVAHVAEPHYEERYRQWANDEGEVAQNARHELAQLLAEERATERRRVALTLGIAPGMAGAKRLGCTCPAIDNHHGLGRGGDGNKFGWFVSSTCPLHAAGYEPEEQP